jgi:hypothetical protein
MVEGVEQRAHAGAPADHSFDEIVAEAGDDHDLADAARGERVELPLEQSPAGELDQAFGALRRQGQETRALAGAEQDGFVDRHGAPAWSV